MSKDHPKIVYYYARKDMRCCMLIETCRSNGLDISAAPTSGSQVMYVGDTAYYGFEPIKAMLLAMAKLRRSSSSVYY